MMDAYQIVYSPEAKEDLRSIYRYIAYDLFSKNTAKAQTDRIRKAIRALGLFPEKYVQVEWEPWKSMGMRRMPVDNYLVYYLLEKENGIVMIDRIFYKGRNVLHIIQEGME